MARRGAQVFGLEGATRMPAATMGRRAKRTSDLIVAKARAVFLAKGYYGTSIDDIADAAEVSRASFYTYFPSKRDVLLKIGQEGFEATHRTFAEMRSMAAHGGPESIEHIVEAYLDLRDRHGAFVEVWAQAILGDDALRRASLRAELASAKAFVDVLIELGWEPADENPTQVAFALQTMMDRYWFYSAVAGMHGSRASMIRTLASIIQATVQHRP